MSCEIPDLELATPPLMYDIKFNNEDPHELATTGEKAVIFYKWG